MVKAMDVHVQPGITALSYRDAFAYRAIVIEQTSTSAIVAVVKQLDDITAAKVKATLRKSSLSQKQLAEESWSNLLRITYPKGDSNGRLTDDEARAKNDFLAIVDRAYNDHVTDIHFEITPDKSKCKVRFRRDGRIQSRLTQETTRERHDSYVNLIRLAAATKSDERSAGGSWSEKLPSGRTADIRVQILDSGRGEEAILRLTGTDSRLLKLDELSMPKQALDALKLMLRGQDGAYVVVGPVNSGKSTLQRAILLFIDELVKYLSKGREEAKIVSVEMPIEMQQDYTQIPLVEGGDMSFDDMAPKLIRADYDALNIGEINETNVKMFCRIGLAGKIVLGSFHARDALAAPVRLLEMGVGLATLSNALRAVIYTRTLPRLCESCKVETTIELMNQQFFRRVLPGGSLPAKVWRIGDDAGCKICGGIGTSGFYPFFEMLQITPKVIDALRAGGAHADLFEAASDHFTQIGHYVIPALEEGQITQEAALTLLVAS